MKDSFGPCTTAIDTGSSAQLSTFWQRRLAMLPGVSRTSVVVSRRGRLLLVAAATIALILPTMYLSHSVAASAEKPDEGQPFRAVLPGGMIVDVLGMANHPSKGAPWWAPDGTPTATPYEEVNAKVSGAKGELHREIAIRWIRRPPNDVIVHWSVNDSSACGGTNGFDKNGTIMEDVGAKAATFSVSDKTCMVTLRVAAGPWETFAETEGRNERGESGPKSAFVFSKASEHGDTTAITISHNVLGRDLRVVAVDEAGKETVPDYLFSGGMRNFVQTTAEFSQVALKDIKKFRLQARPYQTVEIRDIALNPGQATKPHLVVVAPELQEKPVD